MASSDGIRTFTPSSLATLRGHFTGLDTSLHGSKWDQLWTENFAPWDRGVPNPALDEVLTERKDLLGSVKLEGGKRKKALVPGCGMGYDVLLLAAHGYDAYGLEISENALKGARKTEAGSAGKEEYAVRDKGVGKGKVTFLSGDYFKDDFVKEVEGDGKFDIIFDYTFLCALPPSLRPAWALRKSQLLSPTGRLICLEFPSTKPVSSGGPPYALPPVVYEGHLPRPGQELAYDSEGNISTDKLGEEAKDGLVMLAHIKPKKTHQVINIGVDESGKVLDWVGVWAHK
ncbi:putative thiol methyltransferase [Lachnellula suecica]|uniref:Putative thiol methyltransferase n=1 Tax=Lachnellula suecica TaxID=602035 RepID=A0A8T9C819_9HELO|nr:putative thiol methyltransferase [Lachnellula suecica]